MNAQQVLQHCRKVRANKRICVLRTHIAAAPRTNLGPGVVQLLLCEQFISCADSSLSTPRPPEEELSCFISFKLVLSLDFPVNKPLSRCHYLISIF